MLCRILFVRTEGIRAWVFEQGSELQQGVPRRRKRKFEPFALGSRTHLVFQLAVCFWVLGLPLFSDTQHDKYPISANFNASNHFHPSEYQDSRKVGILQSSEAVHHATF